MPEKPDLKKIEEKNAALEKAVKRLQESESRLLKENNELKEIKKYYDVLMQNTEDYILICDSSGIPKAFNLSYKETVENLLGIKMDPGVMPFKKSGRAKASEYWESLQKRALEGEKFTAEYSDDEGGGYFETIFFPVIEGEKVTGFTEITRNITDHKKTEKALEESNSFRLSLLEHSPIAILVINPDTSIRYVNPIFEKLTGYTSKEVIGLKYPYPWMVDDAKYGDINIRQKEGVHLSERKFQKKNGEYSWVEIDVTPIYRDGELSYLLGTWIDIADRKRSELEKKKLEEKLQRSQTMESLGLLAGGVAHDLNNVLAGIVSYPDLILSDMPEDNKLRKPLEIIKQSGSRATAIVQDLLTIARGVATEKNTLNLNDLINDYLESPEFEKLQQYHPSITIKTHLDNNLLNVKGSHIHLRKVLMNLVSNASEAIEGSGSVTISSKNCYLDTPLKAFEHVNPGEYAVISVADSGTGISPDDMKRVFEPFYTKKVMGRSGTGLGLTVVWNVMREHNGYINVVSDKKGTTFELYFSITREELADHDSEIPLDDLKGNGQKILIVDDVESQRLICGQILEKLGYYVHTVSCGEEAVEYLKNNTVDLVLLDMIMAPGINGLETYKRILEIHPHQRAVLTSGYVATDEVKRAQELGAGALLKKPVILQRLGVVISEELKKN